MAHYGRSNERRRARAWSRSTAASRGPAQLVLTASVARRYYLDGRSKVEIAERVRAQPVQGGPAAGRRPDQRAGADRDRPPGRRSTSSCPAGCMDALGLQHCVVIDTPDEHPAAMREHLGAAAAELLTEIVTPDDVLGLAWARSVSAMATALTAAGHRARRAADRGADPARGRRQLDRAGPRGRAGVRRAGVLLLRPDDRAGRRHGAGAAPAAGGGAGVRPDRLGDQGGRRRRRLGAGTVHPVRRHRRGRARGAGAGAASAPTSPGSSSTPTASPVRRRRSPSA